MGFSWYARLLLHDACMRDLPYHFSNGQTVQLWAYGWAFVDPNRKLGYNIFGAPLDTTL